MHGDEQLGAVRQIERFAPQLCDRHSLARQASGGGHAQRDNRLRLDHPALIIEPELAALDLVIVRPLMQPAFSPHLVLEMLHRVGDEGFLSRNAGIRKRLVENASGGTDERLAGQIFLVAGLFADQHEGGVLRPLAGHRLGRIAIERAAPAIGFGLRQFAERWDRGGGLVHNCRMPARGLRSKKRHKGIFMSLLPWPVRPAIALPRRRPAPPRTTTTRKLTQDTLHQTRKPRPPPTMSSRTSVLPSGAARKSPL